MSTLINSAICLVAIAVAVGCALASSPKPDLPAANSPPAVSPMQANPGVPAANSAAQPAKGQSLDELLLFFPSKFPDGNWKPDGLKFEDAWFSAPDGPRLHGWYCPCDNPRAILLFAHGNAGNLTHRSPWLKFFQKELRVSTLIFDYRGYGQSEGTPTVDGVLQDARAARKFLAGKTKIDESEVVLMGESLGGAVVADLAGRDGARGLILQNTFSSLHDVAAHHYPKLAWLVPGGKLDSATRLTKYKGPLLQSHGDADRTIPFALGQKLYDAAPGNKQFFRVVGGDHNDGPKVEYLRKLDRFIADLPKK